MSNKNTFIPVHFQILCLGPTGPLCENWMQEVGFFFFNVFSLAVLYIYMGDMCVCVCVYIYGFLGGVSVKESACQFRRPKKPGLGPSVRKIPWKWQPTPLFSPGNSHGQKSRGREVN